MTDSSSDIMDTAWGWLEKPVADDQGNTLSYFVAPYQDKASTVIAGAILAERERCLSIVKDIETRNEAEAHLIETIIRRMRGDQ